MRQIVLFTCLITIVTLAACAAGQPPVVASTSSGSQPNTTTVKTLCLPGWAGSSSTVHIAVNNLRIYISYPIVASNNNATMRTVDFELKDLGDNYSDWTGGDCTK